MISAEPSAPKDKPVVSNVTPDSCKLSWEAPDDDGGSPITGYVLEKKTSFSPRWNKVTREPITEPEFTVEGTPACFVDFINSAVN